VLSKIYPSLIERIPALSLDLTGIMLNAIKLIDFFFSTGLYRQTMQQFRKNCSLPECYLYQNAISLVQDISWLYKLYLLKWCQYFFAFSFSIRGQFKVLGICPSNIFLLLSDSKVFKINIILVLHNPVLSVLQIQKSHFYCYSSLAHFL